VSLLTFPSKQLNFQQGVQGEGQAQCGTFSNKHSAHLFQAPENNGELHELDTTMLVKVSRYLVSKLLWLCSILK
jgi:hypothetical protein